MLRKLLEKYFGGEVKDILVCLSTLKPDSNKPSFCLAAIGKIGKVVTQV